MRLVLSCEHGGNTIPRAYRSLFGSRRAHKALAGHRGWDPGALPLARNLAKTFGAPLFAAQVSRLLVDLNRSAGHPALLSEYSRRLGEPARARLLATHYFPHRERIREAVETSIRRGRPVCHIAVHSFAPRLSGQERLADIGLLYDSSRSSERRFCERWRDAIRRADASLRVRCNYPYLGKADGLTTALRREFGPRAYVGIELEINQRRLRREPGRLAALLTDTLAPLVEHRLASPK